MHLQAFIPTKPPVQACRLCKVMITLHNKVSLAVTLSLMHLPKSHDHSVQGLQKEGPPAVAATCFATPSATPAVAPTSSLRMTERLGGSAPAVCACSDIELAVSVSAGGRPYGQFHSTETQGD